MQAETVDAVMLHLNTEQGSLIVNSCHLVPARWSDTGRRRVSLLTSARQGVVRRPVMIRAMDGGSIPGVVRIFVIIAKAS